MVESKDGFDDGGGDRHRKAVAVSRRDAIATTHDDLANAVHLLLHEPIRVAEVFEHGGFVDVVKQLRSVLEAAIRQFAA